MTTTVTTTTVPCSYYLSAQAQSVPTAWVYLPPQLQAVPTGWVEAAKSRPNADFLASFGRSSECSIYADDLKAQSVKAKSVRSQFAKAHKHKQTLSSLSAELQKGLVTEIEAAKSAFQFSLCGSSVQSDPRTYVPPGVSYYHIGGPETDFYCCGSCTLLIREIKLLYFPATSGAGCSQGSVNTASQMGKRAHSILNNHSILITDGYTL